MVAFRAGVDVAIGMHPLEVASWAPRGPAGTGMAASLRGCLRRELPPRLKLPPQPPPGGRGEASADVSNSSSVVTSRDVVVDGLNYFTGDWSDGNQSHYNPAFRSVAETHLREFSTDDLI